ncbi:hypothetical protein E4U54_000966, partial [Claviceps lovelessii]
QWGPIVGTGLAAAGSLYLLLVADIEAAMRDTSTTDSVIGSEHGGCTCEHHQAQEPELAPKMREVSQGKTGGDMMKHEIMSTHPGTTEHDAEARKSMHNSPLSSIHAGETDHHQALSQRLRLSSADAADKGVSRKVRKQSTTLSAIKHEAAHGLRGRRQKWATAVLAAGDRFGYAVHSSFDLSKFRDGAALEFPEIPGERQRNDNLPHIRELYSKRLEEDGTPAVQASRSRASSFNGRGPSGHALADHPRQSFSRDPAPLPGRATSRSTSPSVSFSASSGPRPRASTLPVPSAPQNRHAAGSLPTDSERGSPPFTREDLTAAATGTQKTRLRRD